MKKRLFSLFLALLLCASLLPMPAEAAAAGQSDMLGVLAALGVMNGDPSGDLHLADPVTRAEFSKMAVAASSFRDLGKETAGISPFSDVPYTHWAAGYIATARDAGWLTGYLDGSFRPNAQVTLTEAVTVVLKMLGYTDADFTGTWPSGQMTLYRSLKLDTNLKAAYSAPLTRLECAWLLYNALGAATRSGALYGPSAGCPLDASGNPDYLALINDKLEGPYVVVDSSWLSELSFTPKAVYRNDVLSTAAAVSPYDILYTCPAISAVYAYSIRHTGTLDAVAPNRSAPASVVLSGVSYPLGTPEASLAVSNLGSFQTGDTVCLLMGRDGTVAAVVSAQEASQTLLGLVTGTGTGLYTNAAGGTYSSPYTQVLSADGTTYQYPNTKNFSKGDVVQVLSRDGSVTLKKADSGSLSGAVSADASQLGAYRLSDSVQILDVYKGLGRSVPARRLSGVRLNSGDILAASFDASGAVDQLILNNVTGDLFSYGLVLSATVASQGMSAYSAYRFLVNGQEQVYQNASKSFTTAEGPAQIGFDSAELIRLQSLPKLSVSQLTQTSLVSGGARYTLSGSVQVYRKDADGYRLTPLETVLDLSAYTVTAYYDKPDLSGGRVRILIAKEK